MTNENIYNPEITELKNKIKTHENDIIEKRKVANDLNEFNDLYTELNGILNELSATYKKTNSREDKEKLASYLSEEIDYLELINNLLEDLNNYHDVVGVSSSDSIKNEWNDVFFLVLNGNLERTKKRLMNLASAYPGEYDAKIEETEAKVKEIEKNVLIAEKNMMDKKEVVVNTIEKESTTPDNANIHFNEDEYSKMNLDERIVYVESIMANIEKAHGKKNIINVNGEKKQICSKYVNRYRKLNALLNNLHLEKVNEEEQVVAEAMQFSNISEALEDKFDDEKDAYLEYKIATYKSIKNASGTKLGKMVMKINSDTPKSLTVVVTLPTKNKSSMSILKDDLEEFNIESKKYKEAVAFLDELGLDNAEKEKKSVISEIAFLMKSGKANEKLKEQVTKLVEKYKASSKKEKLDKTSDLTLIFQKAGTSIKESQLYAKYVYALDNFKKNKNISDGEKKSIFSNILNKLKKEEIAEEITETEKKDNKIKMAAYGLSGAVMGSLYATKLDVIDVYNKVSVALAGICDSKKGLVSKIKKQHKPINKEKIKANIKKNAPRIGVILGMSALIGVASYANQKNIVVDHTKTISKDNPELPNKISLEEQIGDAVMGAVNYDNVEETTVDNNVNVDNITSDVVENTTSQDNETTLDEEQEYVTESNYFTVKDNAPVYTNMYDAATNSNSLNPYFEADSQREISGIAYEYNGEMVFLNKNDSNYEEKKAYLENDGAKEVAVLATNEHDNDYEGFYNIEDVNLGGNSR
jgi:hypothetical protein